MKLNANRLILNHKSLITSKFIFFILKAQHLIMYLEFAKETKLLNKVCLTICKANTFYYSILMIQAILQILVFLFINLKSHIFSKFICIN